MKLFHPEKRYQECGRIEKIYRRKAYLSVPLVTWRIWINSVISGDPEPFEFCWGIAVGVADTEMKWYYTSEEVFARVAERKAVKASQAEQFKDDILRAIGLAVEKKDARVQCEHTEAEEVVLSKKGER